MKYADAAMRASQIASDASNPAVNTQLRVWRDLNQDGPSTGSGLAINQAGEMQTLAQAGIASIGVQGNFATINLGQGNSQIASGSFARTDGTSGESGVAELSGGLLVINKQLMGCMASKRHKKMKKKAVSAHQITTVCYRLNSKFKSSTKSTTNEAC